MTISIVYNSYTIPESAQKDKMRFEESYDMLRFETEFVLEAATATALTGLCNSARAALSAWDKALSITFGSAWITLDPADNSGFLARPRLQEVGSPLDTETSRHYRFSVEVQLPADESGDGGRQSGSYTVGFDEYRRRTIMFEAAYTSVGSDSAYTLATTNGPTWAASVLSALSITTTDTVSETVVPEHRTKKATYRATYVEQIEADSAAGHVAGVINSQIDYTLDMPAEMGIPVLLPQSIGPPALATVTYSGTMTRSVWADANQAATTYRSTIRPWLLSRLADILAVGSAPSVALPIICVRPGEQFSASRSNGRFSGRIQVMLAGQKLVAFSESIRQDGDTGEVMEKLWDGLDHTWAEWGTGGSLRAHQFVRATQLDSFPDEPVGLAPPWQQRGAYSEMISAESWGTSSASAGSLSSSVAFTKEWQRAYVYVLSGSSGQTPVITGPRGPG